MLFLLLLSLLCFLPISAASNSKCHKPLTCDVSWVVPSWRELRVDFLLHYLVHFWIQLFMLYSDRGLHGVVCLWQGGATPRDWQPLLCQSHSMCRVQVQFSQWFWCIGTSRFTFHSWMRGCAIKIFKTGWYFWLTVEFCFARWYRMCVFLGLAEISEHRWALSPGAFLSQRFFSVHHSGFFPVFCRLLLDVSGRLEDSRQRVLRMQSVQRESWYCKPESASTGQGGP